ncbi:MAG: PAS domain-containing protein [Deltaproteobacteria bacterium]|nr:PAS domain-containing protein [Deltaproteobacteria bacterium]
MPATDAAEICGPATGKYGICRFFLRVLAIVGLAELVTMAILHVAAIPPGIGEFVLDSAILTVISSPFLYLWVFKALSRKIDAGAELERKGQATEAVLLEYSGRLAVTEFARRQENDRLKRMEKMKMIASSVIAERDIGETLHEATAGLAMLLEVPRCAVFLRGDPDKTVEYNAPDFPPVGSALYRKEFGADPDARRPGGSRMVFDVGDSVETRPGQTEELRRHRIASFLTVPLTLNEKCAGALFVAREAPYSWTDDELITVEGFAREIAVAVHHERVSRDSREIAGRLISLMNNVPGMVYRGRRDWSLELIGADVERITGYRPDEFLDGGVVWRDLIHPEDLESVKNAYRAAVRETRKVLRVEYRILHRDGSVRSVADRRQITYDAAGNFAYVDGLLLDITARKNTEKDLQVEKALLETAQVELSRKNVELQKAYTELKTSQAKILQQEKMASIGQLAAGVAHEINNPIGFVSSNLGTLRKYVDRLTQYMDLQEGVIYRCCPEAERDTLQDKSREMKIDHTRKDISDLIEESAEGTERVRTIVLDLKAFSRVDEADAKMADINECLSSTINIVWNELKYKAALKREFGEIPPTRCRPRQLNQVFMNLLVNASQAIETNGEIGVRTWSENGHIVVAVSDTGCGIPSEHLGRIFEPFFTTKEVGKGTGLGLSITYDIVKQHNGDISVASEIGIGTTFTVKIPVIREE